MQIPRFSPVTRSMFAREKTHASSVPHPLPTLPNLQVGQQRNPSPLPSGRAQIIGRFAPVDVSNFLQARVWLQSSARSTAPGSMQAVSELSSKGWQTGSPMHDRSQKMTFARIKAAGAIDSNELICETPDQDAGNFFNGL